ERRLSAGRGAQQQEEATAHVRSGAGGLEVFRHPVEGFVDAVELAREQFARQTCGPRVRAAQLPVPAQHVVEVLVAGARVSGGLRGENLLEELSECAAPPGGAMV